MATKLCFEEMQKSLTAVNDFEKVYGKAFRALVIEKRIFSNTSKVFNDEDVFIGRGEYSDHNMPFILVRNENYDCDYTIVENNGDCLTIKLKDKIIDIMPNEKESEEVNDDHE